MDDYDSYLCLISNQQFLNDVLVSKFKDKFIGVDVYKKIDLNILSKNKYDYFILNLVDLENSQDEIILLLSKIDKKTIIVGNYKSSKDEHVKYEAFLNKLLVLNQNIGILLIPEIIGEFVKFNKSYISHDLIMQSVLGDRIVINNPHAKLFILNPKKVADEVVKNMLSFGIFGSKVFIYSYGDNPKAFVKDYLRVDENDIIIKNEVGGYQEINADYKKEIPFTIKKSVKYSKEYFKSTQVIKPEVKILDPNLTVNRLAEKVFKKKKKLKLIFRLLIISAFTFLIPAILMTTSLFTTLLGVRYSINKQDWSEKLINLSQTMIVISSKVNFGLGIYQDSATILLRGTSIIKQVRELVVSGRELFVKIVGDDPYLFDNYANLISANLDRLYSDLNFLQSDIENMNGFLGKELKFVLEKNNLNIIEIKQKIYFVKELTSRLSNILAVDGSKKYLILFQNSMELRPTGGFIGSYAIVTFNKGLLADIVVDDVYSADGQLRGHVDPPFPIQKYLNEGGWYLRDANWDPDFSVSAQKIEWFLDKEIDQRVDGVIAVDLYLLKNLLEVTGPVTISDFDRLVTSENVYEITQSEVEDSFFPGSIKKSSFLTSLGRTLIDEIKNLDSGKYFQLFKKSYASLEGKHIQIYFHDINAQRAIENLNYSGKADFGFMCGTRCLSDGYGLIDANLGVNKSNANIHRSHQILLEINKDSVYHSLVLNYQNKAGINTGNAGIYKNYARILLPKKASVNGVRIYSSNGKYEELNYDSTDFDNRKEIGFYFELNPSTELKIQIDWSISDQSLADGGEYRFYVRKQAGTLADPITLTLVPKELVLTGGKDFKYNSSLYKDLNYQWFMKPL